MYSFNLNLVLNDLMLQFPRASLLQLNDIYYQVQREMFGHQ